MATIRKRKLKGGGVSYTAQIRIKRNGEVVYQENKTFNPSRYESPHATAKLWAGKRENELNQSEPWLDDGVGLLSVGVAFRRYIDELEASPRGIGKTKKSCMDLMSREPMIKDVLLVDVDSQLLMDYLRKRSVEDKAAPATVLQDIIYFRVLAEYARIAWGLSIDLQYIDDVRKMADRLSFIGKSEGRERRPQLDELGRVLKRYDVDRSGRVPVGQRLIPMQELILFLLFSARRLSEVTRIEWSDLDYDNRRVLVRDMKHPRSKKGNHVWVYLPERAWSIVMMQERVGGEARIFPFNPKSISASFQRACRVEAVGVEDLRVHDLRHEGISHYFELGWDIPRVALVSGHSSWDSLKRYTHLSGPEPFDKYKGWEWLKRLGIE